MGSWCLQAAHSYKGPLIAIGIGVGFMVVGAVPVALTFALNSKNSATIIGVGFIGFGLLVVLPGLGWCIFRRITAFRCCHSKQERLHLDDDYSPDDDLSISRSHKTASSTGRACYKMANERCHVVSSGDKIDYTDEPEPEPEEDADHDDGDVRLTR